MRITRISALKDDAKRHGAGWGCPDGHVYFLTVGNASWFRGVSFVGDREGAEAKAVVAALRALADDVERADAPAG